MSVAWYIVLEKPIEGFDHSVNGKALAHASELLDVLAQKSGTTPLMKFWSADLVEIAEEFGVTMRPKAKPIPPEQWFPATSGLVTIRGLKVAARAEKPPNLEKILADLDEFERVLSEAEKHGVNWHLAVDF